MLYIIIYIHLNLYILFFLRCICKKCNNEFQIKEYLIKLDTIINRNFENYDITVVDDASTDNTSIRVREAGAIVSCNISLHLFIYSSRSIHLRHPAVILSVVCPIFDCFESLPRQHFQSYKCRQTHLINSHDK